MKCEAEPLPRITSAGHVLHLYALDGHEGNPFDVSWCRAEDATFTLSAGTTMFAIVGQDGIQAQRIASEEIWALPEKHRVGAVVERDERGSFAIVASPESALARLYALCHELGLDPSFPEDVEREVAAHLADPATDREELADMTELAFVTIDGATSRDLDQALHIERTVSGYLVRYALADCAHYVPYGSALFREALRRGATYYMPGLAVPMLPRALSEGLCSLNPHVVRRALVFEMKLDHDGKPSGTRVIRAIIHSRDKLSFEGVEAFYDGDPTLADKAYSESLRLLEEVGQKRMRDADSRNVVRFRRREVDVVLDGDGLAFTVVESSRRRVEQYNEQVSLLCNAEGARLLLASPNPEVQPIYRVHPAPEAERVLAFARLTKEVATLHGLSPTFIFDGSEARSLSDYLRALPEDGQYLRIKSALERQAILINMRSTFAAAPGEHHGVGADIYARFSAPMREVVGVFLHKELVELGDTSRLKPTPREDEALRLRVIEAANLGKDTQRKVNDRTNRLVLEALFDGEVALPRDRKRTFIGTVMGVASSKLHVALDRPGIDVKIYLRDWGIALAKERGESRPLWLEPRNDGATLAVRETGEVLFRVGDEISIFVESREARDGRFVLLPSGSRPPVTS